MRRRQDKVALGYRAATKHKPDEAERLYREAIAEGDAYAYNNLAQLLIEEGRLREVERLFRKGIKWGDSLAARNLALYLLEEGRERAAKAAIEQARRAGRPPTAEDIAQARAYYTDSHESK